MVQAKTIVVLALAVALGVGLTLVGGHYVALRDDAERGRQRAATLQATTAGIISGEAAKLEQATIDKGLDEIRENFTVTIREVERNEPQTAVRGDRAVPASVRNAYRERRLARERLGCAGRECERAEPTGDAAER